jgi:hypothetical protein
MENRYYVFIIVVINIMIIIQTITAVNRCRSCGRDRMVIGFTTAHVEVYSIQHYVIKCVSDLSQVGGFLQVLRYPPPIQLSAKI